MAYIFFAIVVLFTIICGYFLILNDFNTPTLEVMFPAIGAILLSVYLGYKAIWLDAPEAESYQIQVAVVHDKRNASVHSLLPTEQPLARILYHDGLFDGLRHIDDLGRMRLGNQENLLRSGVGKENFLGIYNVIEFAIVSWLTKPERRIGSFKYKEIDLLSHKSTGYSEVTDQMKLPTSAVEEWNPFFGTGNYEIELPKGSKFERIAGVITLSTPHSTLRLRITGAEGTKFEKIEGDKITQNIFKFRKIDQNNGDLMLYIFLVNVEFSQVPFRRFSDHTKLEKDWMEALKKPMADGFSWPLLRQVYAETNL